MAMNKIHHAVSESLKKVYPTPSPRCRFSKMFGMVVMLPPVVAIIPGKTEPVLHVTIMSRGQLYFEPSSQKWILHSGYEDAGSTNKRNLFQALRCLGGT